MNGCPRGGTVDVPLPDGSTLDLPVCPPHAAAMTAAPWEWRITSLPVVKTAGRYRTVIVRAA